MAPGERFMNMLLSSGCFARAGIPAICCSVSPGTPLSPAPSRQHPRCPGHRTESPTEGRMQTNTWNRSGLRVLFRRRNWGAPIHLLRTERRLRGLGACIDSLPEGEPSVDTHEDSRQRVYRKRHQRLRTTDRICSFLSITFAPAQAGCGAVGAEHRLAGSRGTRSPVRPRRRVRLQRRFHRRSDRLPQLLRRESATGLYRAAPSV